MLGCHKAPRGFAGRLPGSRHAISVADGVASRPRSELSLGVGSLSHAHYLIPKVVEALQHFLATMTVAGCPVRTALLVINSHRAAAGTPLLGLMHPASSLACAWRLRILTWAAVCLVCKAADADTGCVRGQETLWGEAWQHQWMQSMHCWPCGAPAMLLRPCLVLLAPLRPTLESPTCVWVGGVAALRCRSGMGQGPTVLLPSQDASGWGTPFKQEEGTTRFQWSCPGCRVTYCGTQRHDLCKTKMIQACWDHCYSMF